MSFVSRSVPGIANSQLDVRADGPVGNLHKLIARHGLARRTRARCAPAQARRSRAPNPPTDTRSPVMLNYILACRNCRTI